MGHAFWTEDVEDRVKLLESNALNCCLKITTADLSKMVLKWGNDVSEDLAPKFPGIVPHSTRGYIFCLTGHERSLTCWAKI